jgi:hypothetical protein
MLVKQCDSAGFFNQLKQEGLLAEAAPTPDEPGRA